MLLSRELHIYETKSHTCNFVSITNKNKKKLGDLTNRFNPFQSNVSFPHTLKTFENLWFSDIFRGYRKYFLQQIPHNVFFNDIKTINECKIPAINFLYLISRKITRNY